jgi:hypothetical protein
VLDESVEKRGKFVENFIRMIDGVKTVYDKV